MSELYGWTGRVLSVDLMTATVRVDDTTRWVPKRIGALGLGLALLWERVPAGTGALAPDNLLYIGVGPLTATWAPCAGRAVAVGISPATYPVEQVTQSSVGGQWPAELKWAGYDAVAIQGRSERPVYLWIDDERVELRDATALWGQDCFATQQAMRDEVGEPEAKALVIGPIGEKQARNASMIHGTGHALGQCGFGAIAGSKNLKGILVRGSGSVPTATSLAEFRPRLVEMRKLLALMQSVVPSTESRNSRWRAREDLTWSGGEEEVPIGAIAPDDLSRQGLRHCGTDFYMSGLLQPWHAKNVGCVGCVMNCFSSVRGKELPADIPDQAEMNCVQSHTFYFSRRRWGRVIARASKQTVFAGKQLVDLLGVNAYDIKMLLPLLVQLRFGDDGRYLDELDPALREDLLGLPWESIDEGGDEGVSFCLALFEAMRQASPDDGSLGGCLLLGTPRAAARFGMLDDLWTGAHGQYEGFEGFAVAYGAHGQRSHYGPDRFGMPTGMHWVIWNRDPNRHEYNGLTAWSGLTWAQKRRIAEIHFGDPDCLDDPNRPWATGPATPARTELARFLMVRSMLKDSLTLCDWVYPNYCCPDPDREYAGDLGLEAELYRAVTGEDVTMEELDLRAEALVDLYRAITMRCWGTANLRGGQGYEGAARGEDRGGDFRGHDNLASWYFDDEPPTAGGDGNDEAGHPETDSSDGAAGGAGSSRRLDRSMFEEAKTRIYERMGWHPELGSVTRRKLEELDQADVADGLEADGLLPE